MNKYNKIFLSFLFIFIFVLISGCSTNKIEKNYTLIFKYNEIDYENICGTKEELSSKELPKISKAGYYFNGWYLDSNLENKYDLENLGDNEFINLYPKLVINKYKIIIHDDEIKELEFEYNDIISIPELNKDNFYFSGYFLDEELKNAFNITKMPSKNIDLYPYFIEIFNVEYNVNDNEGIISGLKKQYIKKGESSIEVEAIAKEGYRFKEWSDGVKTAKRSDLLNDELIVEAVFEKTYNLSFISNNEKFGYIEGDINQVLTIDDVSSKVKAIPNIGYKFTGWSNNEKDNELELGINGDAKIVANFETDELELPIMNIDIEGDINITSKEYYTNCDVSVKNTNFDFEFENYQGKIKGRGNSTWNMPKKPYKLKFDKKVDLFGCGKAKTWVLLANYSDKSMIRNHMAFMFGNELALDTTSTSVFVDLYLNGNYQGVYQVCEQNEVGKTRVNISESLDDVDTGYLLELDGRIIDEGGIENFDYFNLNGGTYAIKSPDVEDELYNSSFIEYIKNYLSECFAALDSKDYNLINEMIDVDSFLNAYIVNEIMKTGDIGWTSFYIYKKEGGKLYCGPLWDYDLSSGNYAGVNGVNDYNSFYAKECNIWFNKLLNIDEFKIDLKNRLLEKYDGLIECINFMDEFIENNYNSFNRNFIKWDILNVEVWPNTKAICEIHTWEGQVLYLKDWLTNSLNNIYNTYTK